ncbi:MAG TPA: TonB-dependent receptor [bacterium]|nr:TonB-dependent receptor [bacterium]HPR87121.1 TonB-dependent receptor [bacterium]
MKLRRLLVLLLVLGSATWILAGTTGKIAGSVTDSATGQGLPGANVLIKGTSLGAVTDLDGHYTILNVPPGTYDLQISFIGFSPVTVTGVKVNIDLTTNQNIRLKEQSLVGEEITVRAERPVIQKDLAASELQVTSDQIKNLPISSVGEAIGIQAGVTSGLSIRGSGSEEALFMVDGISLRDERDNTPIAKVPLSAVKQVSVQAGGFGAEYNNVRSGLVNVVTREGDPSRLSGTFTFRTNAQPWNSGKSYLKKYFGDVSPFGADSYWLRPYLDDAVCWTGTKNGAWDAYTRRQYPEFDGWNAVSQTSLTDDDPTNDVTPQAAQTIFKWQHRKQGDITKPDYLADFGFGGPVPLIGKKLGNLRFFISGRQESEKYLFEMSRKDLLDKSTLLRLGADITPSMKLSLSGLYGETYGTNYSLSGGTSIMSSPDDIAAQMASAGFTVPTRIYTDIYFSPTSRFYSTFSSKLTHFINKSTYYDFQLKYSQKKYFTNPGGYRDETAKYEIIPGYSVDEAPFGFSTTPVYGIDGDFMMGGAVGVSRDYSKYMTYSGKLDLVSQVNRRNQIKSGVEVVMDDYKLSYGAYNAYLPEGNFWNNVNQKPIRGNFYLLDKLEYEGFIATVGANLDYYTPNSQWYNVSTYDRTFFGQGYTSNLDAQYKSKDVKPRWILSPRMSISHPITENSKLYFNYGHYRQIPTSESLYRVQRTGINALSRYGDPTVPFEKTVAYELGYDHALFNNFLLHMAAYYKDITDQAYSVRYISYDGKVNYYKNTNNSYEDIRGFEVDLSRTMGRWLVGDVNYEYRVETSGYFGRAYQYEDPAAQREYNKSNPVQSKPRPRPRVKAYLDFNTPTDFGAILGDWHFTTTAQWIAGYWMTWNPQDIAGISYNTQYKDWYGLNLKLSKTFDLGPVELKGFVDVYNAINYKYLSGNAHVDIYDYNYYMKSLHLPQSIARHLGYNNIPGSDQPGDYRDDDVEFVPMEWVSDVNTVTAPSTRAVYYEGPSGRYMQYVEGQWQKVADSKIKKILDDKAYIDMPNQTFLNFFNPRQIFFGITLNYNF